MREYEERRRKIEEKVRREGGREGGGEGGKEGRDEMVFAETLVATREDCTRTPSDDYSSFSPSLLPFFSLSSGPSGEGGEAPDVASSAEGGRRALEGHQSHRG